MVFRVPLLREALQRHLPVLMLHISPAGLGQVNTSDEILPILLRLGFLCLVIGLEVLHVFSHFPRWILVGLRLLEVHIWLQLLCGLAEGFQKRLGITEAHLGTRVWDFKVFGLVDGLLFEDVRLGFYALSKCQLFHFVNDHSVVLLFSLCLSKLLICAQEYEVAVLLPRSAFHLDKCLNVHHFIHAYDQIALTHIKSFLHHIRGYQDIHFSSSEFQEYIFQLPIRHFDGITARLANVLQAYSSNLSDILLKRLRAQ
jgi:hypothetical protein